MITAVNPAIIQWARERSGLSLDDLARSLKRDPDELQQWENGERAPSYTTLEDLAYRHFKIPIAIFFFPAPPIVDDPKGSFRRLPDYELERFSPDTIQKIRFAQAYQDSLEDFFIDTPPERMIHHNISPRGYSLEAIAAKVRKYLGISYKQQFDFRSNDQAFKAWRHAFEEAGCLLSKILLKTAIYPVFVLSTTNIQSSW